MFIGRSRVYRQKMVPFSQTVSDQIPDAFEEGHAGAQRSREVGSRLAIVCLNQSQSDLSPPRSTPDVGNGTVLERLLPGRGRISDPGLAGTFACAAQGIQKALGY